MYPFFATTDDHLSFNRNDVLIHLDENDRGFLRGRHRETGKEGWFPKELVREGVSTGLKIVNFIYFTPIHTEASLAGWNTQGEIGPYSLRRENHRISPRMKKNPYY